MVLCWSTTGMCGKTCECHRYRDVKLDRINNRGSIVMPSRFVFFFQAEDGIRDYKVTGVQTCALPISLGTAVELLAAVPSIVYGMWGLMVFGPVLSTYVQQPLQKLFQGVPYLEAFVSGPPVGIGILSAGIILADRKSTRLNSSHLVISYAVFCLKKKKQCTQ